MATGGLLRSRRRGMAMWIHQAMVQFFARAQTVLLVCATTMHLHHKGSDSGLMSLCSTIPCRMADAELLSAGDIVICTSCGCEIVSPNEQPAERPLRQLPCPLASSKLRLGNYAGA